MPLAIVAEESVQEDEDPHIRIPQPAPRPPAPRRASASAETVNTLAALGSVLTVRLALCLAVIGAFVLAILVIQAPSNMALLALLIFTCILLPLSWLATRRVS